jgi:hypothetical protein
LATSHGGLVAFGGGLIGSKDLKRKSSNLKDIYDLKNENYFMKIKESFFVKLKIVLGLTIIFD